MVRFNNCPKPQQKLTAGTGRSIAPHTKVLPLGEPFRRNCELRRMSDRPVDPGALLPLLRTKLSLQEQRAVEATSATSPAARCQSCGGPSVDGDLCKSCQEAYAPVLGSATVTQPCTNRTPVAAQNPQTALDLTTEMTLSPPIVIVDEDQDSDRQSGGGPDRESPSRKSRESRAGHPAPDRSGSASRTEPESHTDADGGGRCYRWCDWRSRGRPPAWVPVARARRS